MKLHETVNPILSAYALAKIKHNDNRLRRVYTCKDTEPLGCFLLLGLSPTSTTRGSNSLRLGAFFLTPQSGKHTSS